MSVFSVQPRARRDKLVVQDLQNELVLYDLETDQASCLNETAALVWKYADGTLSVDQIAAQMAQDLQAPVDARVVWFAVEQLGKKNLLQERVALPAAFAGMTRREFLLKVGAVSAIVAVPVIISLAAPMPAMASTCIASGQSCSANPTACCSGTGNCNGGTGLCN